MFLLGRNHNIKGKSSLGFVFFFILLFSLLATTSTTFNPHAYAFMHQNLLGLNSPNVPGIIAPVNPQIGSAYTGYGPSYGGGIGGYGGLGYGPSYGGLGGLGGQSFGTGLIGLLPQVLGGLGSLFGQGSTSGYGMGDYYGYDSGYGSGFQSGDDEGFSDFDTNNDPFDLGGGGYDEGQGYGFDDSESYSNTPVEDLRSLDSPSEDPFFSGGGEDYSQSPFEDLFG